MVDSQLLLNVVIFIIGPLEELEEDRSWVYVDNGKAAILLTLLYCVLK